MLPDFHNAGYIHEPQDSAQLFHFYNARTKLIRLDFYENSSQDISKKNTFTEQELKKIRLSVVKQIWRGYNKVSLHLITFMPLNVSSYKK